MQSIDSIETHAYRTSTDLISKKEETKPNNIIKQHKICLSLMIILMKIKQNIIKGGHIFQIIHTEY